MTNEVNIDKDQMIRLHDIGGSTLVLKMIGLFFENIPTRIQEIKSGEEKQDWDAVFRAVHSLKSSAGNFGAHNLFGLCGQIETLIREEKISNISPVLRELEESLDLVRNDLSIEQERLNK